MAGINQIITKGIGLVTKYADDAARVASTAGDDVARTVTTASDDVARYVKACGKRSILEIKPIKRNINIEGLRFAERPIGDTVNFTLNNFELTLKDITTKVFEKIYGTKPRSPKNLTILMENIRSGCGDDIEAISSRCNTILKNKIMARFLIQNKVNDVDFFIKNLDNLSDFYDQYGLGIGPDITTLLQVIDKESFALLKSCKKPAEIEKMAHQILYNLKTTSTKLGTKTVEVDFSDVIAIISGKQAISYFKTGSTSSFERTVLKLTEIAKPEPGQQYYHQICEGILEQRPDLIKIVDELNLVIERSQLPDNKIIENFFSQNRLPKTINLRTIVPDENALMLPEYTFQFFKTRYLG